MFGIKIRRNARKATRAFNVPEVFPHSANLSYCERVNATATSAVHIRKLTEAGLKLGGGADTVALCGATVAWDTSAVQSLLDLVGRIRNSHETNRTCSECAEGAFPLLSK